MLFNSGGNFERRRCDLEAATNLKNIALNVRVSVYLLSGSDLVWKRSKDGGGKVVTFASCYIVRAR